MEPKANSSRIDFDAFAPTEAKPEAPPIIHLCSPGVLPVYFRKTWLQYWAEEKPHEIPKPLFLSPILLSSHHGIARCG